MKHHLIRVTFTICTLYLLALSGELTGSRLLVAPFGATAILLFTYPGSGFAHPKNVIGGHMIATLIGYGALILFPGSILAMCFAVGISLLIMLVTDTFHPAAGGNPILIHQLNPGLDFLLFPMLIGTLFLSFMGWIYKRYFYKH